MRKVIAFVTAVLIAVPTLVAVAVVLEGPSIIEPSAMAKTIAGDVEPAPAPDPNDCKTCLGYDECTVCISGFIMPPGIVLSTSCDKAAGAGHGLQGVYESDTTCSAAKLGDPKDCGGKVHTFLGAGCDPDAEFKDQIQDCGRKWRTCTPQGCSDPNLVCPKGKPAPKPQPVEPAGGGTAEEPPGGGATP